MEPASAEDAPFSRVEAKWIKGGENATASIVREPLPLDRRPWDESVTESFLDAARSLNLHDKGSLSRIIRLTRACWSDGRSLAAAAGDERVPVDGGTSVPLYRKTAGMLAMLVGDGKGERAAVLNRLLDRLRHHCKGDKFDPQLASLSMRALRDAAWRHPSFIGSLAAVPGGAAFVISSCRSSLRALLGHIPVEVSTDEHRQKITRLYGTPFGVVCELLLALMAVAPSDPVVAPLRTGSPSADGFAKVVRQIDAQLASLGALPFWRVHLNVNVPPALHRMSPVAFVLNSYLAEGAGANLVQVAGTEFDAT